MASFAVPPLCAVSTNGELEGLAFDFEAAPFSGVSFDLFAVPPLCAVAACGGLTADVDAVPAAGVDAVAACGGPRVDAVAASTRIICAFHSISWALNARLASS